MDFDFHKRKPQEDIPTDVIIHYIVKDYRRMFLNYDEMKLRAEKAEAKIIDLKEKHYNQMAKKEKEIEHLKLDLESQQSEKIKQLEEKLSAAQLQNRLLAQAVISQNNNKDSKILFHGMIPTDAKELEKKIGNQLSDALIKLTAAEERLANYQEVLLNNTNGHKFDPVAMKNFFSKVSKAFNKIESATQHIENFYKLVNGIPMI